MKYFAFVFFILALSACTGTSENTGWDVSGQPFIAAIENAAPEITSTKEFGDCVEPTVKMCITQTANELARKGNSLSICEKLQNEEEVNSCKYGVIVMGLATENTLSNCDELSEKYKQECKITSITFSAGTAADIEICNQIEEEFSEDEWEISKARIDQCKFPIIMGKQDLVLWDCDELLGKAQKDTCISITKNRKK